MLKLYYSPMAVALAAHIALEEAGAEYEAVRMSLKAGDQRTPDYLGINPKGRVPALVTPRGILTETVAILAYIAQAYPAARLAPLEDPFAFAEVQAFNCYLATTVHVASAHIGRGTRWADEPSSLADMARKAPRNVRDCFELIQRGMFRGPWVMGEAYTIADPYLFTLTSWLPSSQIDVRDLPLINEHYQRMSARPAVQRVLSLHKS